MEPGKTYLNFPLRGIIVDEREDIISENGRLEGAVMKISGEEPVTDQAGKMLKLSLGSLGMHRADINYGHEVVINAYTALPGGKGIKVLELYDENTDLMHKSPDRR